MQLTWSAWVLVICAVASFICVVAGAMIVLRANARLKRHLDATSIAARAVVDTERVSNIVRRLEADDISLALLAERVGDACERINVALAEMRLPQAMLALRAAGAAVQLLISGR